jgi:hypothetical protein
MQLQTTQRLGATPAVTGPQLVRAHEEREQRPVRSGRDAGNARGRTRDEAAVLHLGAQALERAQQREDSEAATADPERQRPEREAPPEDQRALADLRQRDREVRGQERTHRSAGGEYAGSSELDYQLGPDGRRYAVAGSTPIDVKPVPNDPEETLRKMKVVRGAATAPANPSDADRKVATEADRQARQARSEMAARHYGRARDLAPQRGAESAADADAVSGKGFALRV